MVEELNDVAVLDLSFFCLSLYFEGTQFTINESFFLSFFPIPILICTID